MLRSIFFLFFISASVVVFGQQNLPQVNNQLLSSSIVAMSQFEIPADALFVDAEEQTLFIDLERIKYNVKEISLASPDGNLVFQKDVTSLPVDAILEINYAHFSKGKYLLEVTTYVQRMHKSISI